MILYHALGDLRLVDLFWEMVRNKTDGIMRLNVLVSYGYFKGQLPVLLRLKAEGKVHETFLDAQTYPMNTDGENPGLIDKSVEYMHAVKRYGNCFNHVAAFDDRFNEPSHNRMNYRHMKGKLAGIVDAQGRQLVDKLIPAIHDDENPGDEFLMLAEEGYKLIGIGSNPKVDPNQWPLIDETRKEFKVGIHTFGNLGWDRLIRERAESADSGRYFQGTKFGREMWFWDEELNEPVKIDLRSDNEVQEKHRAFLSDEFGLDLVDLMADPKKIWIANMFAMQKAQQYLTEVLGI